MAAATLALDERMAELRRGEAELEAIRQSHYAASDGLHAAQGRLAEAALEVSRLEERIRYVVEGRERTRQRLTELAAQTSVWEQRRLETEASIAQVADQIVAADEHTSALAAQVHEQSDRLPQIEEAWRAAQAAANAQRLRVTHVQQQIQVLASEGRGIADQQRQLTTRRDRLQGEMGQLAAPDAARLAQSRQELVDAEAASAAAEALLAQLGAQVPALDEARRACQGEVNTEAGRHAELSARLAALKSLQDKVQTEGKLRPWLAKQGLDGLAGLWTRLQVEPGWETAFEAALRERIHALQVGRVDTVSAFAADAPPAKLVFYSPPTHASAAQGASPNTTLPRLADRLRLGDASLKALLVDWLSGVYTAASLDEAMRARATLQPGELLITREGHAVSAHAVSFYAPDSEQAGLLARAQEIENLDRQCRAQALIADESRSALVRAEAAYSHAAGQLATARRDAAAAQSRAHQAQVEQMRLAQQAEQARARASQLDGELTEIAAQLDALDARRADGDARFEVLDAELAGTQERHAELDGAVIEAERLLSTARNELRRSEREVQESQFSARSLGARRDELQRSIDTALAQVASNAESEAALREELSHFDDASAQAGLQDALALKLDREAALAADRSAYDDLTAQLRRADEQRLQHEQSLQPLRDRITRLQLEEQAAQLGGAQFLEQLVAAQVDLEALGREIETDGVRLHGLQTDIDRLQREIAALGAVNLAALDELTAARERKAFLDAQNADLADAIGTLEGAIHKIDLETRDLLGNTFEQVNGHFGRMFPTLFGGGQAKLVMTGDEILDSGVQVMAQPPGKKNSTIHLLSGGEKALTAIALVFAIFQLNPAPFCLLDEVDAPLDDANTDRYCRLVKEMSGGTQFLFISHNKIAMEMAGQLIGVTMQEQGVSRIVAVDMAEAIGFAEAA